MEENQKIPMRSQVKKEDTWAIEDMYATVEDWEKDFAEIDDGVKAFLKFKGRLAESPETLLAAFQADDELGLVLERLYVYAHLKADEDTGNSANRARLDRISAKHAEIGGGCAWFPAGATARAQPCRVQPGALSLG